MVKDAESHADEDKKQLELVNARNQADQMLHSVKKSLAEHGDKIDAAEKTAIEEASKALEAVLKDGDKATLEAKTQALAAASQKLGEKVYAQAQAEAQAKSGAGGAAGGQPKEKEVDATVVDAEYEEVKDKKSA
jgi:molecular chaperone DnaK